MISILALGALGASPFLPPLLKFSNGSRVTSSEAWFRARRPEVASLTQEILLGRVPDTVPALVAARTINTTRTASSTSSFVNLTFAVVVASVAGFTPMRTDSADRGTGGLARLASMHALAPRLGLYVGDEASATTFRRLTMWNDANGVPFMLGSQNGAPTLVEDCEVIYHRKQFPYWCAPPPSCTECEAG